MRIFVRLLCILILSLLEFKFRVRRMFCGHLKHDSLEAPWSSSTFAMLEIKI
jgi:hypothetical protein